MADIRAQLAAVGERRAAALAELRGTSTELRTLVRQARAQGVPKTEIARLAQISRPALDDMLRD